MTSFGVLTYFGLFQNVQGCINLIYFLLILELIAACISVVSMYFLYTETDSSPIDKKDIPSSFLIKIKIFFNVFLAYLFVYEGFVAIAIMLIVIQFVSSMVLYVFTKEINE